MGPAEEAHARVGVVGLPVELHPSVESDVVQPDREATERL